VIHVKRTAETPEIRDALLRKDKKTGLTERQAAENHYNANPTKTYDFKRYKEKEVCVALDALFNEKCAYCESSYSALEARNVEHYRPKGPVSEAKGAHQGYWWLAATWENLLPSCPICNQRRRHVIYDADLTLSQFEAVRLARAESTTGKLDSFPVLNNNWVSTVDGPIQNEDPLLLNPCDRKPEDHLEWNFDWLRTKQLWEAEKVIALVRPRRVNGTDDPYAHASIGIYGLNREGLVKDRMLKIKDLQVTCSLVVKLVVGVGQSGAVTPADAQQLKDHQKSLLTLAEADRPYSAMVLAFVNLFFQELRKLTTP
jgi:hypothetical protein